jgi:hypothetical protein
MQKNYLENFGFYREKIPQDLYQMLLEECINCSDREHVQSGLTGDGVAIHYRLKDTAQLLNKYIADIVMKYEEDFPGLGRIGVLTNNVPYKIDNQWINHQKQGQFIPNHTHEGIYSYTIWIKMPDIKQSKYAGNFQFTYTNIIGNQCIKTINLSKENEGELLFFPSKLTHCVYPFSESNDIRMSISGNILLDVG